MRPKSEASEPATIEPTSRTPLDVPAPPSSRVENARRRLVLKIERVLGAVVTAGRRVRAACANMGRRECRSYLATSAIRLIDQPPSSSTRPLTLTSPSDCDSATAGLLQTLSSASARTRRSWSPEVGRALTIAVEGRRRARRSPSRLVAYARRRRRRGSRKQKSNFCGTRRAPNPALHQNLDRRDRASWRQWRQW